MYGLCVATGSSREAHLAMSLADLLSLGRKEATKGPDVSHTADKLAEKSHASSSKLKQKELELIIDVIYIYICV